jgi:hypothetical protein
MGVFGKTLGWLGRKALLYVLLFAALLAFVVGTSGDVHDWWAKSETENQLQADQLQVVNEAIRKLSKELQDDLAQAGQDAQKATVAELKDQIGKAESDLIQLNNAQPGRLDRLLAPATLDFEAIRKEQERLLQVAFLERKLSGLKKALKAATDYETSLAAAKKKAGEFRAKIQDLKNDRKQKMEKLNAVVKSCNAAKDALKAFDNDWLASNLDRLPLVDQRKALKVGKDKKCRAAKQAEADYEKAKTLAAKQSEAAGKITRVEAWVENELPEVFEASQERLTQEQQAARNTISAKAKWAWQHYDGDKLLRCALAALILITATPYLIRLLMWFVLAPLAMRRPSIRLQVPGGMGVAIVPSSPSTTSVPVRLKDGEELLVRQDYLQTSSDSGPKRTQWLLDWTKPITSHATGLTFLTRIRGEGETTTISATKDGLAEVTIVSLPDGGSCVLHPRAIAAVAQPVGRPLLITSHWRLNSLNAWLTLQFRYLVFHGPARLVLKGGRGVRVEAAERGRVFGQDQLVGFSADLAYSVTRTETFWPYFLGREPLLKDRVIAGNGVLIVEEAPFTARNGEVRRGLEGMIDAGMKAFGM